MGSSASGLLGAVVGLVLGVLNYLIAAALVQRRVTAGSDNPEPGDIALEDLTPDHRAAFDRQVAYVRRLMFWSMVMVFPVIGYVIGRSFGGG